MINLKRIFISRKMDIPTIRKWLFRVTFAANFYVFLGNYDAASWILCTIFVKNFLLTILRSDTLIEALLLNVSCWTFILFNESFKVDIPLIGLELVMAIFIFVMGTLNNFLKDYNIRRFANNDALIKNIQMCSRKLGYLHTEMLRSENNCERSFPIIALIRKCQHYKDLDEWFEIYYRMELIKPIRTLQLIRPLLDPVAVFLEHSDKMNKKDFKKVLMVLLEHHHDKINCYRILVTQKRKSDLKIFIKLSPLTERIPLKLQMQTWRMLAQTKLE